MSTGVPKFNPINSVFLERLKEKEALDFLTKQECILEIKYEDIGVEEAEFEKAIKTLPEEIQQSARVFMKYLKSPVIRDKFSSYGERREWGMGVLNKANDAAGILYKSNKVNRSNFRDLNTHFHFLKEKFGDVFNGSFREAKGLREEMDAMIGDDYESLSFEVKKKIADKASSFARSVCNTLIKMSQNR